MVEASALFLDIVGFTTLSERTHPEELVQVVNRYLGEFSNIVIRREGMLDKYMGDALMATWGAAVHQPDHAVRACRAALEMLETLERLTEEEQRLGTGVHLRVRIGINSGRMIAGNVGGTKHFSYTVLGDNVNLASRLEGVNKAYGTVVMIGQNTAEIVGETFELREIDLVNVKGKHEPIRIFELQGERGCLDERRCLLNRHFSEGRTLYVHRRWNDAVRAFERAVAACGEDGPCLTFLERCRRFDCNPPAPDWNGSVSLEK
jgi:adenylate cyclase